MQQQQHCSNDDPFDNGRLVLYFSNEKEFHFQVDARRNVDTENVCDHRTRLKF